MPEATYWMKPVRRLSRRRILASTGAGAAGLAFAGCATKSKSGQSQSSGSGPAATQAAGTPQTGGTYVTYIQYNAILDPHKAQAGAQTVIGGVYSRIFRFVTGTDPNRFTDHDIEPDLGISAESPDAVTWTVKLRPDAKFHNVAPVNGHAVEAEDIKATFVRALDPATNNQNRSAINMIDSSQIQTPDKQTVVFKLNYAYAPFRKLLASPAYSWIFPREVVTGSYDPSKTPIGSGPFTLESFTPDVAYVYKKNPDWFEKGRPYVDGIKLVITADASQQLAQFSAGNMDEITIVNPFDLDAAKRSNPKATVVKSTDGRPFPLYLQLGDPSGPMMDARVRQALSMAIDREAIAKVIYNGQGVNTLFVPAYMGKWATLVDQLDMGGQQWYKYDPAAAKKLLEAAGQTNLSLRLGYIVNAAYTTPPYIKTAETLANMLNAVGVKTAVITQDNNKDYVDAGKGSRQGYFDKDVMIFSGIPSDTEADQMLYSNFHGKSTTNAEHLSDPTLDEMIDKERSLVNEDDRLKSVQGIEKYIGDKVYVIPTPGSFTFTMVQPRVQNFSFTNTLAKFTENYSKIWLKV
jgi:peptide/nickel transport system substrate-binding protein